MREKDSKNEQEGKQRRCELSLEERREGAWIIHLGLTENRTSARPFLTIFSFKGEGFWGCGLPFEKCIQGNVIGWTGFGTAQSHLEARLGTDFSEVHSVVVTQGWQEGGGERMEEEGRGDEGREEEGEGKERCSFKAITNKPVSYLVLCLATPAAFQCVWRRSILAARKPSCEAREKSALLTLGKINQCTYKEVEIVREHSACCPRQTRSQGVH